MQSGLVQNKSDLTIERFGYHEHIKNQQSINRRGNGWRG